MAEQSMHFVVWDSARERSRTIPASSLNDLIIIASGELELPVARVCLEQDGTEVDEDEYFSTLECGTALMVLEDGEKWRPFASRYQVKVEKNDRPQSPTDDDLEVLSNMDPDCLTDIVPDKLFLEAVRDACQACRTGNLQQGAPREAVNSM